MGDRPPRPPEPLADKPDLAARATDAAGEPDVSGKRAGGGRRFLRELGVLALMALVIAVLLKTFLVQAFYIPSGSMEPTLLPGDRILVNRLAYRFGDIERGDIIVFADPTPTARHRGVIDGFAHWLGEAIGVVRPADDDFIKRVVALPGETWEIRNGVTYIDGRKLDEPYVNRADPDTRSFGPETVPDGMLFVMGDNRNRSGDSRFPPPSGLGYIPIDRVIGQAFVTVWPPARMAWLR